MAAFCKRLLNVKSLLGEEFKQFMCLGLDQAGKTTLLYRLKLGRDVPLNQSEMRTQRVQDMSVFGAEIEMMDNPDYFAGYLYEEYQFCNNCGIWDIPGTPAMRQMWKYIYQTIQMHGIFFVFDGEETGHDTLERRRLANKHMNLLLNEEELRQCFIAIIVNQKPNAALPGKVAVDPASKTQSEPEDPALWWTYELGIDRIPEGECWRVKLFLLDVDRIDGEGDPKWGKVVDFAKEVLADPKSFNMKIR